ncbi:abscisic acid aba receptor [Colletotrichum incanum]|uniref:Abscisic acid aba receptor n=1 Tax=Colletotrichum incanum TaxID=1573173 RepID=A0A167BNN3_COLIC|nr:abscisic acid aba receptor [Colletotrichum incanum]
MDPHPLPTHLSKLLSLSPPQSTHPPSTLTGPLTSHTGLAYLFLAVSADHPRLQVHSYPAIHWARAYISNIPTPSAPIVPFRRGGGSDASSPQPPNETNHNTEDHPVLGLLSDALASPAVRACITKDLAHVRFFLSLLAPVMEHILSAPTSNTASSSKELDTPPPAPPQPLPTCLLHGLAGTLYLLRLIRHWVPSSAPLVSRAIVYVSEYLLSPSTTWTCPSHSPSRHTPSPPLSERSSPADRHGAAHGDLGTITQIILTSPPLAPSLTPRLSALLDLQLPNGDWPSSDRRDTQAPPTEPTPAEHHAHPPEPHVMAAPGGVGGFASGPQGLVISLLSLRPFFPALQGRIDDAIGRAREFLWAQAQVPGPAREVNLFYGVLGTVLCWRAGTRRKAEEFWMKEMINLTYDGCGVASWKYQYQPVTPLKHGSGLCWLEKDEVKTYEPKDNVFERFCYEAIYEIRKKGSMRFMDATERIGYYWTDYNRKVAYSTNTSKYFDIGMVHVWIKAPQNITPCPTKGRYGDHMIEDEKNGLTEELCVKHLTTLQNMDCKSLSGEVEGGMAADDGLSLPTGAQPLGTSQGGRYWADCFEWGIEASGYNARKISS